jgi:hypothetical protein
MEALTWDTVEKVVIPAITGASTAFATTFFSIRYRARRQVRGLLQIMFYILSVDRERAQMGPSVLEARDALIGKLLDRIYDNDVIAHENIRTTYALYGVAYTLTALQTHPDDAAILYNAWADVVAALVQMNKIHFLKTRCIPDHWNAINYLIKEVPKER